MMYMAILLIRYIHMDQIVHIYAGKFEFMNVFHLIVNLISAGRYRASPYSVITSQQCPSQLFNNRPNIKRSTTQNVEDCGAWSNFLVGCLYTLCTHIVLLVYTQKYFPIPPAECIDIGPYSD